MSHGAPDAAAIQREIIFAEWLVKNHNTAIYWAAATGGLIGVFAVAHWARILYDRCVSRRPSATRSMIRAMTRPIQRLNCAKSLGPITILPGRYALALGYLGFNVALTFYDHPQLASMKTMLSKRFGWLALCNLFLAVLLGLKNTPLSPLAGVSFDSLNVLHRCVGYTTVLFMVLHATTYIAFLCESGAAQVLAEREQYAGAVASCAMLVLLCTSIGPVRRRVYELFYHTHLIMVALIIIAMGLHRPEMTVKAIIITILTGAIWFADKSLRLSRWVYYAVGNYGTLEPLAENVTRVTLHRSMRRARPGSSVFLWLPGVKKFQRHPFTLLSSNPVTFLIRAEAGFTQALYEHARQNPSVKLRASIEGPYGHVPNAHNFDKVVLIAGGTGVSFTMAVALDWSRTRRTPKDKRTLDFIWVVKNANCLEWLDAELNELEANPRINVTIRVTQTAVVAHSTPEKISCEKTQASVDVGVKELPSANTSMVARPSVSSLQNFALGRPDTSAVLRQATESLTENQRLLVAACGPEGLLNGVRNSVAKLKVPGKPSIEMYLEQFSF